MIIIFFLCCSYIEMVNVCEKISCKVVVNMVLIVKGYGLVGGGGIFRKLCELYVSKL